MIEAKFKLGDEAVMMHNNEPIRVFVMERFFVKREYESRFLKGDVTSFEYMEYKVCTRRGMEMHVHENQLFNTKEELFKNFGDV